MRRTAGHAGSVNANEVILHIADQDRATAFYAAVLGSEPTLQVPGRRSSTSVE